MTISLLGAIVALVVAIGLILRKVPPVYGMLAGAFFGAVIGGASLTETVGIMLKGAQGILPAVLRILAAGILAGVLIQSGAAKSIAEATVKKVGETRALLALALATLILTMAGVFIDVAVITVAPIALAIAQRAGLSQMAILLAMVGGGKAGNLMSPNPNAIAASDAFKLPLTDVMIAGIFPAIFGLIVTYWLSKMIAKKGPMIENADQHVLDDEGLPSFFVAMLAPLVALCLLALRPLAGIAIDPMIALPVGGLAGVLAMGKWKNFNEYATVGLGKMTGVAIMLLGTGALAGVIAQSELKDVIIHGLQASGLPSYLLAPISGILMSGATASTTAGTAVASQVFGPTIIALGVSSLGAAAMIHSGATVLDHLPHGSFFHATGGSVHMSVQARLKLIPYETAIGFAMTIVSTLIFGVFQWFG